MQQNNHWIINGCDFSVESNFIKKLLKGEGPKPFIHLKNKTGVLFSNATLNNFIKEEALHNNFTLTKNKHRSIRTFSSGEQKKALLNYLLSKKPDFLILENAFDLLDQQYQKELLIRLNKLSKKITIIQIFKRVDDILPFIKNIVQFKDEKILFSGLIKDYKIQFQQQKIFSLKGAIPPSINHFNFVENPLIQFKNVSVNYANKAILNNINWTINRGDFWQLFGPNGSGKTTLLTMITGDNPKAFGQDLKLFGRKKGSGETVWDIKKKIGYVTPAMTTLFTGRHTVENMIISGVYDSIGLYKQPTSLEKKIANQWVDLIGLTDLKNTWFFKLSEEQQCMVLIARAMIKHPPLLILDEPTHGLNDYNVARVTTLVNKIAKDSNTTIIYVSHKKEKGLIPTATFELIPTKKGSIGKIII